MYKKNPYRKIQRILVALTGVVLIPLIVTSCALPDEFNQDNIVNQFFPNFWVFIAHIIALIILLFFMIYFLWKPTKRNLAARNALIQKNIDDAANAQKEALTFLQEANDKRLKASMEASQIVSQATHEGFKIKSEIEDSAKRSANMTIQNAKQELSRRERVLREEMHEQIISVALNVSEALTKKNISRQDNEKFIEDFIKELEEANIE
ncbi:F0F1 ATP synthase subunit B [[Mycoplasma] testudinis]|uniref:F0F1 ATP synthase subunit B n=1 Tax=[Mycoplasma] testudinis TaxID=33924 RepID=UPI000480891C|nr:F0F1 ATP synthase subunit B [[Mycoplasma] testudinis]